MIGARAFVVGRNVRTRFFSRLIYRWVHRCSQTVQFHLSLWIPTYRHSSNINQKHVRDAIAAGRLYISSSVAVADGPNPSIPPLSTPQTSNQTKQKKKLINYQTWLPQRTKFFVCYRLLFPMYQYQGKRDFYSKQKKARESREVLEATPRESLRGRINGCVATRLKLACPGPGRCRQPTQITFLKSTSLRLLRSKAEECRSSKREEKNGLDFTHQGRGIWEEK